MLSLCKYCYVMLCVHAHATYYTKHVTLSHFNLLDMIAVMFATLCNNNILKLSTSLQICLPNVMCLAKSLLLAHGGK